MAVLYELAEQWEEVDERRASTATRAIVTDWSTRKDDAPAIGSVHPGDSDLKLARRRFVPHSPTGTGGHGSGGEFTAALVTLEYSNWALESDGETFLSVEIGGEVIEVGGGRTFSDGTTALGVPLNKVIPWRRFRINKAHVLVPDGPIMACWGCLNLYAWTPPGKTEPLQPETVLFEGCDENEQFDAVTGIRTWCCYSFLWRPISHNMAWRTDTLAWDDVLPPPYDLKNFGSLGL